MAWQQSPAIITVPFSDFQVESVGTAALEAIASSLALFLCRSTVGSMGRDWLTVHQPPLIHIVHALQQVP